ncbi:MAG: putative bifunctional diguanylate cyclase/phosphodiesterase [Solirubrobacterales bacterium]
MVAIQGRAVSDQAILETLFETMRDAVVLADGDRRITRVNKAFQAATGHSTEALLARRDGHAGTAYDLLTRALSSGSGGRWQGALRCADGSDQVFEVTVSAVNGEDDFPTHYLGLVRPSDEIVLDPGQRRFGHDELTGLPNRDIFIDRVEQSVLQCNRSGAGVALMMMGLDRFTLVNDALGHAAGDRLLIEVARRLRHCIRETDTVVRLEGDKFALVMMIADLDDSVIVAEKVLNSIKEPFSIDGQEVVVTFSIGIALYPQDANGGPALIKQAENALHYAKVSGRNQYQFFSKDMNRKARNRLELEARMRRALANDEFAVFFQPKVSADTSRIVGAEALVRWNDPERGMISPAEFIPVAEETGLIEQIGNWVLLRSCIHNRAWQDAGLSPVRVSVNVSPRQFRSRGFLDMVDGALEETGLAPRWLELEITESMLMHDVEAAVRKMSAIREMGIGLSIDDFGTGYSSLSYLGRFPITTLKIDRAFIADVDTNPKTAEIARAIIGLSKGLNLEVVAEGAEVAEHVQFLRQHGCHTVQGFYYSKPVPADAFEVMLREGVLVREG